MRRLIKRITRTLPPTVAARLDRARPGLAQSFGPFNGQRRRQEILGSVLTSFPFDLIIETGTYRGTTTERLRAMTSAPIISIELSKRYYEYARRRLSRLPEIAVLQGDSAGQIRRVAAMPTHDRSTTVFAYLDAHWGESLPTRYEVLELLSGWDSVCAVIDDFKVPGDSGYGYDDYGPGLAVDTALLAGLPLSGVSLFFPSVPSSLETGHRRGWAVLGRGPALVELLIETEGLVLVEHWESRIPVPLGGPE